MDTLHHIAQKFGLKIEPDKLYVEIPEIRRDALGPLFKELGFTVGAEVGVEGGLFSEVLLEANPELKLYSIDRWVADFEYRPGDAQDKVDAYYNKTKERLARFPNSIIVRQDSLETAKQFEDGSLDFVYIDADHTYAAVVNDINEWTKKVRVGGIVAGHDYARYPVPNNIHVVFALEGYAKSYGIKPVFIIGRKDKKDDKKRNGIRSWMFVKQ